MTPSGPLPDTDRLLAGRPENEPIPQPPLLPEGPWAVVTTWDLTAWSGPWGVSYAINLIPDDNTGIGIWTEDMFVKSIKLGQHMGTSRPVLPPMPWQTLRNLADDDLKAMYAYLRTLKPIKNRVPDPVPPSSGTDAPK